MAVPVGLQVWEAVGDTLTLRYANPAARLVLPADPVWLEACLAQEGSGRWISRCPDCVVAGTGDSARRRPLDLGRPPLGHHRAQGRPSAACARPSV